MSLGRARAPFVSFFLPPLPAERNGLLDSWRLDEGRQPKLGAANVLTRRAGLGERGRGQAGATGALHAIERLGTR